METQFHCSKETWLNLIDILIGRYELNINLLNITPINYLEFSKNKPNWYIRNIPGNIDNDYIFVFDGNDESLKFFKELVSYHKINLNWY